MNSYPIKRKNDTGIDGEFGDLVVNHMLDELEQVDPNLIKKLEDKLSQLKRGLMK